LKNHAASKYSIVVFTDEAQGVTRNGLAKSAKSLVLFCVDGGVFLPFSLYLRSTKKEGTNLMDHRHMGTFWGAGVVCVSERWGHGGSAT
jgi:hypothetical protein